MIIFVAVLFGLLPSFVWLVFFLKEDNHPEPKKIIFKIFIFGAVSALIAIIFQKISLKALNFFEISKYAFGSFLVLSLIEEVIKFLAAYLAVYKSKFFDEPIDAMIYMITAAMGFAAMENIFVAAGSALDKTLGIQMIFGVLVLRFIGATLLHALSSSIIGYYWAKKFISNGKLLLAKGAVIATVLHAIFNLLILKYNALAIYPIIFLIIIALFVFWDFEKIKKS